MKKVLYGTTALVSMALVSGAASAAEKMHVGVAGYHQQWISVVNQDNDNAAVGANKVSGIDFKSNSEVWFKGSMMLDNGITVGIDVQLEGNTSADQIDESYAWFSSDSLGKIILGSENSAAYLLHVGAPDGGVSVDSGDVINIGAYRVPSNMTSFYSTPFGTTNLRPENDATKITYFTPRFFGFQAGASYWAEAAEDSNTLTSRQSVGHDGYAFGLNYNNKFNNVGVKASFGYVAQDPVGSLNTANFVATGRDTNIEMWNAGAQVSFAGFSLGGAYATANDGAMSSTVTYDSTSWTVGANYSTGPYTVGINYFSGEAEGDISTVATRAAQDTHDVLVVSGTYVLGPGVKLVGGFYTFDDDEETNTTATTKNDGWGVLLGTKISF